MQPDKSAEPTKDADPTETPFIGDAPILRTLAPPPLPAWHPLANASPAPQPSGSVLPPQTGRAPLQPYEPRAEDDATLNAVIEKVSAAVARAKRK